MGGCTYSAEYEPWPLYTSRFHKLKEIDHSLSFQSLQLSMDADECASTTNTITEVGKKTDKISKLHNSCELYW